MQQIMIGYEKPFSAVLDESTEQLEKIWQEEEIGHSARQFLNIPDFVRQCYWKLETWCALNVLTSAVEKHHHLSITTKVNPTLVALHGMQ